MSQRGFTLLELMVAMAIFAMLAVAGWQVFDGVTQARERAQYHADQLAVLQYAYLQVQQDMAQMVAFQAPPVQDRNDNNDNNGNSTPDNNKTAVTPEPFMRVSNERVSFMRFADPDPRYQSSPTLQYIEYVFADQRLIRRQYHDLQGGTQSSSLDSVLLENVSATSWHAYLPDISATFPNKDNSSNNNTASNDMGNNGALSDTALLPKGIGVNFTYQDIPISWQWAMTPQPISYQRQDNKKNSPANNQGNDNNGNNNSDNNNDFDIDSSTPNDGDSNNEADGVIVGQ